MKRIFKSNFGSGAVRSIDGVRIGLVGLAEFIQMLLLIRMTGPDRPEISGLCGNVDPARELIERTLPLALDPHVQFVVAIRNIFQMKYTLLVCKSVIRCGESNDDCAHLGMNIAENVGDAFARKYNAARSAGLIQSKIKSSPVKKRKNIMKERVRIGKC